MTSSNSFPVSKMKFLFPKIFNEILSKLRRRKFGCLRGHLSRKICRKQILGDITVHHCMIRDINQSPNSLKVQINAKLITQTLFWLNLCDSNWTRNHIFSVPTYFIAYAFVLEFPNAWASKYTGADILIL